MPKQAKCCEVKLRVKRCLSHVPILVVRLMLSCAILKICDQVKFFVNCLWYHFMIILHDRKGIIMIPEDQVLEFPCAFSIKSIGEDDDYRQFVTDTVAGIVGELDQGEITTRLSNGNKYLAVTVPFTAQNREQLKAVYQALNQDVRTRFVI
ncbi:MAG: hypothetical protein CVU41_17480 [Chloroflexi bacterium HGW-Chloroflexi-3]|nr:MAG: hypothetical protein CVU41_17480 [Chloroflexi bacterium HGW-Chloroflexi-3]